MKTNHLKSVLKVMMAVSAMVLFGSASANTQKGKTFYINENDNVKEIYTLNEDNKTLTPELKYEFIKDSANSIVTKKSYRWNEEGKKWVPYYLLATKDINGQKELELYGWNNQTKKFDRQLERYEYLVDPSSDSLLGLRHFVKDGNTHQWVLTSDEMLHQLLSVK